MRSRVIRTLATNVVATKATTFVDQSQAELSVAYTLQVLFSKCTIRQGVKGLKLMHALLTVAKNVYEKKLRKDLKRCLWRPKGCTLGKLGNKTCSFRELRL